MMGQKVHIEPGRPPLDIEGLTADSREVKPGFLFAAMPGSKMDGRAFIGEAIERGASAVLAPSGTERPSGGDAVAFVTDEDPRRRLALMAAEFYGAQPETVVAATGTNGKTSVAWFVRALWSGIGRRAASLGTLGLMADGQPAEAGLTTPEPVSLHAKLARLAEAGITHLAMEASSHGLALRRLDGVRIVAGGFTSFSRDHLDFHGTEEAYFAAKARLFEQLIADGGTAVINADLPQTQALAAIAKRRGLRLVGYGSAGKEIRLIRRVAKPDGSALELEAFGKKAAVELPLIGAFQTANALCALGLATAANGEDGTALVEALASLPSVPGRLERVGVSPRGGAVYVDYAHTPDALSTVLEALREHTPGRLSVVFGCGGDRDPGKRPLMGAAAARLADSVIVTDDNPRTEDPARIRKAALEGCPGAREIGDRGEAIATAIDALGPGDVLVIAGKGHEPYQIVGTETLDFDDREAARAALGG